MFRFPAGHQSKPSGQPSHQYRLVILGGGAVGKTALLKRFLYDEFIDKHKETVEDLYTRSFEVNGHLIQTDILDTAGNMSFPAMRRLSITNANAFLLVHSVDSESSFQDTKEILNEIKSVRGKDEKEFVGLPIVIASNKCDLPVEKWEVKRQQIDEFMLNETMDCHAAHLETSAKTGHNVVVMFETFVRLSPLLAPSPVSKKFPRKDSPSPSSTDEPHHQNGTPTRARLNSGPVSPRRRPRPAPTIRRFSLQAFILTGNTSTTTTTNGAAGKTTPPPGSPTPTNEPRKGSMSPAITGGSARRFKSKTKSHEDLDMPQCFVQ